MQLKIEFAKYDDSNDTFELDENIYTLELDEDQTQTYELFKGGDLHLYNWFQTSELFTDWIKESVYPDLADAKVVICDIDEKSFRRFFFFKVTSGDSHYDYFKKLFDIYHDESWQDREDVGREILEQLREKRKELIIDLSEEEPESEEVTTQEKDKEE